MGPTYEPANGTNIGRELINSRSISSPTGFPCSSEIRGQTDGWFAWKSGAYFFFHTLYLVFSNSERLSNDLVSSVEKNRGILGAFVEEVGPRRGDRKMEKRTADAYLT